MGTRISAIIACPICHSRLTRRKNGFFCSHCKKNYLSRNDVPNFLEGFTKSDVNLSKEKWETIYETEEQGHFSAEFAKDPTIASYIRFLTPYKKYFQKGIFLDLGCGVAVTGALLAEKGVALVGTDISHSALIKSKKIFLKRKLRGDFLQANLINLPFKDESIAFVYSCMSLEYVKDTEAAIAESRRVLSRGGKMLAIVPAVSLTTLTYHQLRGDIPNIPVINQIAEWIHLKVLKGKYMHYGYEKSFTSRYLKRAFTVAGFTVNDIDYYPIAYDLTFLPQPLKNFVISFLHFRPFWPLLYIEATKR